MFQRGVTLIELMVVIAIVAILSGIAVPSFSQLIADTSLSSQVNGFMADARFARSEAMKRGVSVTMCPSGNAMDISPTCSTASAHDWKIGWITFIDTSGNGERSTDEQVLRRQEALSSSASVVSTDSFLRFNSEGRIPSGSGNLLFTSSSTSSNVFARKLCISMSGKIRLVERSAAPVCST